MVSELSTDDQKRLVLGFTVILATDVSLLRIDELRREILALPGVAAVAESSIPIQKPIVRA